MNDAYTPRRGRNTSAPIHRTFHDDAQLYRSHRGAMGDLRGAAQPGESRNRAHAGSISRGVALLPVFHRTAAPGADPTRVAGVGGACTAWRAGIRASITTSYATGAASAAALQ